MASDGVRKPDRESQLWSLALIALAVVSFPFVTAYVLAAALWHRLLHGRAGAKQGDEPRVHLAGAGKTAIVTGGKMTKALVVCRHLKAAGCRVVLVETHKYWMVASRFTNAVDRFVTVPLPEKETAAFLTAMRELAHEEDADLFVPVTSPVASFYEAKLQRVLPAKCRTLSLSEETTALLDDKVAFAGMAATCGLPVPDTRRMTSKAAIAAFNDELRAADDGKRYVLKNLQYDSMRRLDCFTLPCAPEKLEQYIASIDEVSPAAPWGVQAFCKGTEYSTCAVARDGELATYSDNVASISCFNYEHQSHPGLRRWVERFVRYHNISGIVCIDFFVDGEHGTPMAIECNPRFSSNIVAFDVADGFGAALLDPSGHAKKHGTVTPSASRGETCWLFVELWYTLVSKQLGLGAKLRKAYDAVFTLKDAYYEPSDPLPFLALHYLHIPTLLARNVAKGNRWAKIDMCIGKLTEEDGD